MSKCISSHRTYRWCSIVTLACQVSFIYNLINKNTHETWNQNRSKSSWGNASKNLTGKESFMAERPSFSLSSFPARFVIPPSYTSLHMTCRGNRQTMRQTPDGTQSSTLMLALKHNSVQQFYVAFLFRISFTSSSIQKAPNGWFSHCSQSRVEGAEWCFGYTTTWCSTFENSYGFCQRAKHKSPFEQDTLSTVNRKRLNQ